MSRLAVEALTSKDFNRWQSVLNQDEDNAQMKHAATTEDTRKASLLPVVGEKGHAGPETEVSKDE